jgi:hypothetical protein
MVWQPLSPYSLPQHVSILSKFFSCHIRLPYSPPVRHIPFADVAEALRHTHFQHLEYGQGTLVEPIFLLYSVQRQFNHTISCCILWKPSQSNDTLYQLRGKSRDSPSPNSYSHCTIRPLWMGLKADSLGYNRIIYGIMAPAICTGEISVMPPSLYNVLLLCECFQRKWEEIVSLYRFHTLYNKKNYPLLFLKPAKQQWYVIPSRSYDRTSPVKTAGAVVSLYHYTIRLYPCELDGPAWIFDVCGFISKDERVIPSWLLGFFL